MSHARQGPPPKREMLNREFTCEQVHVNESFVMWFNTITLKQFIAPLYWRKIPSPPGIESHYIRW